MSTIIANATAPTRSTFHTYYHDNFSIASGSLVVNRSEFKVRDKMDWNALTTPYGVRRITRRQTEADADAVERCRSFSEGDNEKQEFYSPNYPNDYGNHTDCVKIIEGKGWNGGRDATRTKVSSSE